MAATCTKGLAAVFVLGGLGACGQKGPLYLQPAPAANASASASAPAR